MDRLCRGSVTRYTLALFLYSFIRNGYRTSLEPGCCARKPLILTLLGWYWCSYCWVTVLTMPAANVTQTQFVVSALHITRGWDLGTLISRGLKPEGLNLDPNSSGVSSYSGLWLWLWLICPKHKVKLTNISLRQLPRRTEYHYKKDIKIQKALVICVESSFQ